MAAEEGQLKKYVVDAASTKIDSYELLAVDYDDAKERYRDGVIIHSEVSGDEVTGVHLA